MFLLLEIIQLPFHSQDLTNNPPYCLSFYCFYDTLENLVLDQVLILLLIFFFVLNTCWF